MPESASRILKLPFSQFGASVVCCLGAGEVGITRAGLEKLVARLNGTRNKGTLRENGLTNHRAGKLSAAPQLFCNGDVALPRPDGTDGGPRFTVSNQLARRNLDKKSGNRDCLERRRNDSVPSDTDQKCRDESFMFPYT
ncbi:hypothetical protein Bbelb_059050 [Branchiostoma belcheri]|nr:hypothetical protein Bbelb_059050 [Branchiostoma belcheri]